MNIRKFASVGLNSYDFKIMFYQLIVVGLAFFACNAQEHLTCLRTDDVINPPSQPNHSNTQQGRPGRRGPPGPKGEKGVGLKGEPGIPDNSQINMLRGKSLIGS